MIVAVQLFARARDLAGTDVVRSRLAAEGDGRRICEDSWPAICPPLAGLLDAFGPGGQRTNSPRDQRRSFRENDEVALLPPVSGG